jgi:hypothetical protein
MTVYVWRNGKMVEKHLAPPKPRSGVPYVISDEMPSTRHMATNRYFTSKAKFRAETKAAGCIEIGEESKYMLAPRKQVPLDRAKRREDIKRTIYNLRNGRS